MKLEDPYSFVTWAMAFAVGNQAAEMIGPYLLIMIACTSGAWVALGRRDPDDKPKGFTFLAIVNVIALISTTLIARGVASNFASFEERLVFAPIAFVIGWIGLDYPTLIPKVLDLYIKWRTGGRNAQ